ncbi:MAG: prolipoprotein diacylglyceryl transferase, partial [Burkholderiales bacterium]|nr:prolipoprotein diacylglyceryl transferase [Burkholderiales bacterium]
MTAHGPRRRPPHERDPDARAAHVAVARLRGAGVGTRCRRLRPGLVVRRRVYRERPARRRAVRRRRARHRGALPADRRAAVLAVRARPAPPAGGQPGRPAVISDLAAAAWVHTGFEYGGIGLGAWVWRRRLRAQAQGGPLAAGNFAVLVGLLLGAGLGNKLVFLVERPDVALALWQGLPVWPGQSIVGGLLGGLVGVELAKRATGQVRSTGDALVVPLVLGIVVGRIGCFLAGL